MATGTIHKDASERLILKIPSNTYPTFGDAIAALEQAYDTLTSAEKRRSFIMLGHDIYRIFSDNNNRKAFFRPWYDDSPIELIMSFMSLTSHVLLKFIVSTSGLTMENQHTNTQDYSLSLYVYY